MKTVFTESVPFSLIPANIPAQHQNGRPSNLLAISNNQAQQIFGPFPFRFARSHIDRLTPGTNITTQVTAYTNDLLQYLGVGLRDMDDLISGYATPSNFESHLHTISRSTLFAFGEIAAFRSHAAMWNHMGEYDANEFYPVSDPRRYTFKHEFGRICEIFMYDVIEYYFKYRGLVYELNPTFWLHDWILGIDGFIDGIPFDFTIQSPTGTKDGKERFERKLINVSDRGTAILGVQTWYQGATMTLLRKMLLDQNYNSNDKRKRMGIRSLPNYIFEKNIGLLITAIDELVVKTDQDIRPEIKHLPKTLAATDYMLEALSTI